MRETQSRYLIIKNQIIEDIENGKYRADDKIPSESEFCKEYNTSRITVRRALDELVAQGVLYRAQGIGTFVKKQTALDDKKKFVLVLPFYIEAFLSGIFTNVLSGVEKTLGQYGYSYVTIMEPINSEGRASFINSIKEMSPLGIIYVFYFSQDLQSDLVELGIPVVYLDAEPKNNVFDIVCGDDYDSSYRAVQMLIGQGCRKIGYYSQFNAEYSTNRNRLNGVKNAVMDLGGVYEERFFSVPQTSCANFTHDAVSRFDIISGVTEYLRENDDIEALIVMNDHTALATTLAVQELHKSIPKDIKLISYGNYCNLILSTSNKITSYEQHFDKYGREAAKLIVQRVAGELPSIQQRRIVKFDLIRRISF